MPVSLKRFVRRCAQVVLERKALGRMGGFRRFNNHELVFIGTEDNEMARQFKMWFFIRANAVASIPEIKAPTLPGLLVN